MDKKPFPSETQERFIVRFPDGMRDRIAEVAKTNNRSMNAEIVARLQDSFDATQPKPWETPSADEIADKVLEKLTQMTSRNDRDAPIEVTIRGKKKILERGPDGLVARSAKPAK